MAVVGEAGVGKSRLFWEFPILLGRKGASFSRPRQISYGNVTTYFPVIELLHSYFQIKAHDDTRKIREKVTGKLLSFDRALERVISPLCSLLDVPFDDEAWTGLDPVRRRERTLDAVAPRPSSTDPRAPTAVLRKSSFTSIRG